MKNKVTMSVFSMATLLTFGAANPAFSNDCNPCAAPVPPPKPVVVNNCNPCTAPAPPPKPVVVNNCNPCTAPIPLPKPVVANDCNPCAVTTTNVSYHPVKSGTFHERLVPKDADGDPVACLDISGSSVKVGVDWTRATNNVFTSGTHTTKYNSATVVEERYQ